MTPPSTPPAQLTDEQLIEKVAVAVMGWHMEPDLYGEMYWVKSGVRDGIPVHRWNPLADWNHTMQVVEKLYKEEWAFSLLTYEPRWLAGFSDTSGKSGTEVQVKEGNPQRAILLAALAAIFSSSQA
jgi:hypothetical protein